MTKREKVKAEKIHPVEKVDRVVVEDAKINRVKDWIIYLWRDNDIYYAAAKVRGQLYGHGWKIETDVLKKDSESRGFWQARRNAVIPVDNLLNALKMYGKGVLNSDGNIEWDRMKEKEKIHSWFGSLHKIRKFPIMEITPDQARKYKLI